MTTPTREQVEALDAAAALAVCEKFGFEPSNAPYIKRSPEYAMALVTLAMSAGRDQGLREAAELMRELGRLLKGNATPTTEEAALVIESLLKRAAAIEQLRGK